MQKLFNVSVNYSKSLDKIRGPERKKSYLKRTHAWIQPSSARRGFAKVMVIGGSSLVLGVIGVFLFRKSQNFKSKQLSQQHEKIAG